MSWRECPALPFQRLGVPGVRGTSVPRLRRKVLPPSVLPLDHHGPDGRKVLFCQSVCRLRETWQ